MGGEGPGSPGSCPPALGFPRPPSPHKTLHAPLPTPWGPHSPWACFSLPTLVFHRALASCPFPITHLAFEALQRSVPHIGEGGHATPSLSVPGLCGCVTDAAAILVQPQCGLLCCWAVLPSNTVPCGLTEMATVAQ